MYLLFVVCEVCVGSLFCVLITAESRQRFNQENMGSNRLNETESGVFLFCMFLLFLMDLFFQITHVGALFCVLITT